MDAISLTNTTSGRFHLRLPPPIPVIDPITGETITSEHVTESMRLSRAENLWRFMHSDTHREPILSQPRAAYTSYSTSSLSSLTQRANQRLEDQHNPDDSVLAKTASSGMLKGSFERFPSDSDFKRVMERLNRVYAQGGVESLKVSLQEGKSHEFLLDTDDWMYARITLQGQLCPLVINVYRVRGRLLAFTSKTIQEPMDLICDQKFTGDRIWVSDPGVRFRTPTLYIGFHALEEATFAVNVQFGQKKKVSKEKWKIETEAFASKNDEWSLLFGSFVEKKPKQGKNFIASNRMLPGRESPERISYLIEKYTMTDLRRQAALKRWRDHLHSKKQRALEVINRAQLKEIERQKQLQIAKEKAAIANIHGKWLAMVWATKSFDCFCSHFSKRKAEIAVEKLRIAALMKLQFAYKRHIRNSDRLKLGIRRSIFSFRFSFRNLCQVQGPSIRENLVKCIRSSVNNALLPIKVTVFHYKGMS